MKRSELFLEEAVLDDLAQDYDLMEIPISQKAFKLVAGLFFLVLAAVIFKVLYLGWWHHDFYAQQALINSGQKIALRAERGIIFDRFDKPLVKNIPIFRLNIKLVEYLKNENERQRVNEALQKIIGVAPKDIENLISQINLEKQNSLTVARRLTVEQVIKIESANLSALQIENDFDRAYSAPEESSHILGYTGALTKDELNIYPEISFNDVIGKSGLEAVYDKELRGKDGYSIAFRNAKGEIMETQLFDKSQQGSNVYTTIDSDLNDFFYKALKQGLKKTGQGGAVGIALNPQTGEILSLVSLPSFNNSHISAEDLNNPLKPFFNRAVSGVYVPGSTIKPLVALAALKENIITPQQEIFSQGYLEIPNPYFPDQPSRFLDWKKHGWVNFYSALARSSNVYFYIIGGGLPDAAKTAFIGLTRGGTKLNGLGISKLKMYWKQFGLGQKTGIDLPNESEGFLPDPEEKEKRTGEPWRLCDTYNVSIGQGDFMLTPLQLINYIAAIANNGKMYKPFLVKKITTSNGETIK